MGFRIGGGEYSHCYAQCHSEEREDASAQQAQVEKLEGGAAGAPHNFGYVGEVDVLVVAYGLDENLCAFVFAVCGGACHEPYDEYGQAYAYAQGNEDFSECFNYFHDESFVV